MSNNDGDADTHMQLAGSKLKWKCVETEILTYWANKFGLSTKDFLCPGTTLLPDSDLADSYKAKLYRIKERSIIYVDPNWTKRLRWVSEPPFDTIPLSVNDMLDYCNENQTSYGCYTKNSYIICYLAANNFVHHPAPDGIEICRLLNENSGDNKGLDELIHACSKKEIHESDAYAFKFWPVIFGAFKEGWMVGCGACRYLGNNRLFAYPGLLVHPHHRREAIAIAIFSVICEWCIANGKIVVGHRRADHPGTGHIDRAIGLKDLVIEETIGLWHKKVR